VLYYLVFDIETFLRPHFCKISKAVTKEEIMQENTTILAVDDTEVNVDILMGILKKYDVIPALNGRDAIDIALSEDIDLILLDIMMPELDGYEVCNILKQNEKTKSIPIIFITAKTTEGDIKEGFERGAVDYVTKPFNPIELISRVDTHLELRSYQKELEKKVQEETLKNRLKDRVLYQNSKQAAIGELIMHIAHQWKQPLSELGSINLNSISKLMLGDEAPREDILNNCKKSEQIIKFMSDTVQTFQDFYKPDSKNSFFDIDRAITKATNIISATLAYHDISIMINKKNSPKAHGIENEYAQIILNLLTNAKDALIKNKTPNKAITIDIEQNGDRSKVTIRDNGGGIDEKILPDIFVPFSSSSDSGVGLYMSKTIIEKLGGTLEAKNIENGAEFTVVL